MARHEKTVAYVRDLIALRKNHPAFRLGSTAAIQSHLSFLDTDDSQLVAYQIPGSPRR